MQETNQSTPVFDLNALLTEALKQAIHQATKDLYLRIAMLEGQLSNITTASDERIKEIADDAARMVLAEHTDEYDHDGYDRTLNNIDDVVNDAVGDAVRDLSFTVTVD